MSTPSRKSTVAPVAAILKSVTGRTLAPGNAEFSLSTDDDVQPYISLHDFVDAPAECMTERFLAVSQPDGRIGMVPHPRTLMAPRDIALIRMPARGVRLLAPRC